MSLFLLNLLLALAWAALTGQFTLPGLAIGFSVGFAALWAVRPLFEHQEGYFGRIWRLGKLVLLFHRELVVSSVSVAWDVLTPRHRARPGIFCVPLRARSEAEVLLITNYISLTPGTLSLDISEDCDTLVLHAMFADDPEAIARGIEDGVERLVLDALS